MKTNRLLAYCLVPVLLLVAVAWTLRPRTPAESLVRATPPRSQPSFEPTVGNAASPTAPAPEGMVWIPGGEFSMGANDPPDMDEVGIEYAYTDLSEVLKDNLDPLNLRRLRPEHQVEMFYNFHITP